MMVLQCTIFDLYDFFIAIDLSDCVHSWLLVFPVYLAESVVILKLFKYFKPSKLKNMMLDRKDITNSIR